MKTIFLLLLPLLAAVGFAFQSANTPDSAVPPLAAATSNPPVAVVELFTSQGCSSCPPADQQLAILKAAAAKNGTKVYALSFHVDYWNYLGWKDPFSDAAYSQRQYQYRDWLSSRVYTPQMIVNGSTEFIGSRAGEARVAVKAALSKQPAFQLTITPTIGAEEIDVAYVLDQVPTGQLIVAALVEKEIKTAVKRGENHGKELTHVNVVRSLAEEKAAAKTGTLKLKLPLNYHEQAASDFELIVFIQDQQTGKISGAVGG